MGRVSSNSFGLAGVRETTLNNPAAAGWFELEPNGSPTLQAEIATIARNPISPDRQRKKGTISDLTANVSFDHDVTMDIADTFLPGFVVTRATNADMDFDVSAVSGTGSYTLVQPASGQRVTASVAERLPLSAKHAALLYGAGFGRLNNDGLLKLKSAVATNALTISLERVVSTDPNPVAEAGSTGRLYRAGILLNGGATPAARTNKAGVYNAATRQYTLTTESASVDWTSLGLTPGETISLDGHFGRLAAVTATTLVLEQTDAALQAYQPADAEEVMVLFGKYIRNVGTDDTANYLETTYHFEASYPGLGDGSQGSTVTAYEYAEGCYCNQITINVPTTDKVTMNLAFVATDVEPPVTGAGRKAGASNARNVNRGTAFSSVADVARLRVTELDEDGLTTFFKTLTLTINNNATPEKVIGNLGAEFVSLGDLHVDIETTVLFTNGRVLNAIRNNESTAFKMVLNNDNGALAIDIPAMTIGGGAKELPENQAVTISLTGQAFAHPVYDNSIGISIHPYRKS